MPFLRCTICAEIVDGTKTISATECGHIFHTRCLFTWIERTKSCPKCRIKINVEILVSLELNVERNKEFYAYERLLNEKESLRMDFTAVHKKKVEIASRNKNKRNDIEALITETGNLKESLLWSNEKLENCKRQFETYRMAMREGDIAKNEISILKTQLLQFKRLQHRVDCTLKDDSSKFEKTPQISDIITWITGLKRQIENRKEKSEQMQSELESCRQENNRLTEQLKLNTERAVALEDELTCVANEIEDRRNRLNLIERALSLSDYDNQKTIMIRRLLTESPMPDIYKPFLETDVNHWTFFTSPEISSSHFISKSKRKDKSRRLHVKPRKLKIISQRNSSTSLKRHNTGEYDGLGGSSSKQIEN